MSKKMIAITTNKEESMKNIAILIGLAMVLVAGLSACATVESGRHKYAMRGQILESDGSAVYLCIGSNDGAEVGQELTVYKFERITKPFQKKHPGPSYKREATGKVKITEIVDEHMATAKVLTGEAKVNYVVELDK
jgi:hypothetical protein